MALLIQTPTDPLQAYQIAAGRGLLPTALGSFELRELDRELRRVSVFSARTTNAEYLGTIREAVAQILQGELDEPQARLTMLQMLDALGYTPEGGFPEDVPGDLPPAVEGTLQDLRSFRRRDLILRTQMSLMRNAGLRARGMTPQRRRQFPAWELVRIHDRAEPRVWQERWREVGGELVDGGRMIALKTDGIWSALGSSEFFDDALDTAHPPYAFNSGMGWVERDRAVVEQLLGPIDEVVAASAPAADAPLVPVPVATVEADPDWIRQLKRDLDAVEAEEGKLTMERILADG